MMGPDEGAPNTPVSLTSNRSCVPSHRKTVTTGPAPWTEAAGCEDLRLPTAEPGRCVTAQITVIESMGGNATTTQFQFSIAAPDQSQMIVLPSYGVVYNPWHIAPSRSGVSVVT